MTKLTIKEKMAEIIRKRTAEFSKPFYSDDDLAQILANTQDAILKDFARLICEEMEKSINYCDGDYSSVLLKTQEILKALE